MIPNPFDPTDYSDLTRHLARVNNAVLLYDRNLWHESLSLAPPQGFSKHPLNHDPLGFNRYVSSHTMTGQHGSAWNPSSGLDTSMYGAHLQPPPQLPPALDPVSYNTYVFGNPENSIQASTTQWKNPSDGFVSRDSSDSSSGSPQSSTSSDASALSLESGPTTPAADGYDFSFNTFLQPRSQPALPRALPSIEVESLGDKSLHTGAVGSLPPPSSDHAQIFSGRFPRARFQLPGFPHGTTPATPNSVDSNAGAYLHCPGSLGPTRSTKTKHDARASVGPFYRQAPVGFIDTEAQPYPCRVGDCTSRFSTKAGLHKHLFVHFPNQYFCANPTCHSNTTKTDHGFSRADSLKRHLRDPVNVKCATACKAIGWKGDGSKLDENCLKTGEDYTAPYRF
ncbi:hypothetical protein DFH11DRAFT_1549356 [Phellopilus nigrolimitatus]|nr:hypothetical protein DFH11DRAFT_1549356 [Phellopilus nigrolimitatus]